MTFRNTRWRGGRVPSPSRPRRDARVRAFSAHRGARAAVAAGAALLAGVALLAAPLAVFGAPSHSSRASVVAGFNPDGSTAATAAPAPTRSGGRPADLNDVGAWIDYKRESHKAALPDEARLFYRRGRIAHQSGHLQEATRLVRGAAELDPAFVTPHLTLASWALARDPSQALLRYAVALDLARRSFLVQIELVANLIFFTAHGLFLGLLAACLIVVFLHQAELRHMWEERLARWLTPSSARLWAWGLLAVPFVVGFGLALPCVCFLGLLWPVLRARERTLFITMALVLLAAPFAGRTLGRLAGPLHDDQAPLYGVARLTDEAWTPERQTTIARLAAEHPDNPYLQFGLGWLTRQSGDLAVAEAAYRRTLALWPKDSRTMNNLANVLVLRGETDAAIALYRAAIDADPENAAAPFNLSLVYTRQFEYRAASEAIARASALDFELVKNQQALGTADGVLSMADLWIAPATFWDTILKPSGSAWAEVALPAAWNGRVETSGLWFATVALLIALGSVLVGLQWQRSMPLRQCRNCARVVCRRCSQRRRELALCPECARQESLAESPEFARMLLARRRGRRLRGQRMIRHTLALLVPGYGLLSFQRVFRAVTLLVSAGLMVAPALGVTAPFSYHSWPGLQTGSPSTVATIVSWVLIYITSLLGYAGQVSREAEQAAALREPVRSRPTARAAAKAA
jgi:tetratricopeptide (TPR) repeat protein